MTIKALLYQLLEQETQTILEIGANDGSDTEEFVRLFPNAVIYAFEPDPRAIAKFKMRRNDPRVVLSEIAIGAVDGEAVFHVSGGMYDWDKSGSLKAPKNHLTIFPWVEFKNTIIVPVRKLDSWISEQDIKTVDFIWADIQGAEDDLIIGGRETLRLTRYFYTEYSDQELYEGQLTLAQLAAMLPNFVIIRQWREDVLFKNIKLNG